MLVSRDYDIIEEASWMACVPLSLWAPIYVVVLSSSGIALPKLFKFCCWHLFDLELKLNMLFNMCHVRHCNACSVIP